MSEMGLLDFLFAGKRMEEIKMALVGKHVFDNLISADQKNQVIALANQRFRERTSPSDNRAVGDLDLRVQYVFLALAMAELGIDHGLKRFQWSYVRNPFMVQAYDEKLWGAASDMLRKEYGLNVSL
jgi:hypothetical protein